MREEGTSFLSGGTMAIARVEITVDPNTRDMTYKPSVLHVNTGDTIKWTSPDGEFTLVFAARTPFGNAQSEIRSNPAVPAGHEGQANVDTFAPGGSYRYQTAVSVLGRGVFLDPGCGEVIIK
jgi:plastocyanin